MNKSIKSAAVAVLAIGATAAHAIPYSFYQITANGTVDVSSQLRMDVTAVGSGVQFLFSNVGPVNSSITDIYFDDYFHLSPPPAFTPSSGVSFSAPASPVNLPGGSTLSPSFLATAALSSDSDSPIMANGINPGESLGITFSLFSGINFSDIIDSLDDGSLRVGMHVQSIGLDGQSEGYVNTQRTNIEVPDGGLTALLLAGALGTLAAIRRRI